MNRTDKILITGGAGLVGQNLIVHLKSAGYTNLVALDKHSANTRILRDLHPDIEVMAADLSQPGDWEQALEGVSALVLLHAQIGGLHEEVFVANNVTATDRVLSAAQAGGVRYLVHVSSSVVRS
ncbi:MAG: NAD-dependent epimerase/dehydratase family protein, partial [Planctomycetes bacterium]|nr:NAD-dependent epimerase/dehydratase family protein [Planctomycetota bacterium]